MKIFNDLKERHILFHLALSGGTVKYDELQSANLAPNGIFGGYDPTIASSMYKSAMDQLKSRKFMLTEGEFVSLNERGMIEKIGEYGGDRDDADFLLQLQDIQHLSKGFQPFIISEEDINIPENMRQISEEVLTAYKLFKNSNSKTDYALVIAACGRAMEKIREKLSPIHESKEKDKILGGADLLYFIRNKKGAHPEKEADRITALSCLLSTVIICRLINEFNM